MTEHSKEVMDKRRKGFEDWYSQACGCDDELQSVSVFMRDERDQYAYGHIHESFTVWCAALDSVAIELPYLSRSEYANQHSFNCAAESMGYAREAIESTGLGLRVK